MGLGGAGVGGESVDYSCESACCGFSYQRGGRIKRFACHCCRCGGGACCSIL